MDEVHLSPKISFRQTIGLILTEHVGPVGTSLVLHFSEDYLMANYHCCSRIVCVWDCCGVWVKLSQILAMVALHPLFELFILLCIVTASVITAMKHYDEQYDGM